MISYNLHLEVPKETIYLPGLAVELITLPNLGHLAKDVVYFETSLYLLKKSCYIAGVLEQDRDLLLAIYNGTANYVEIQKDTPMGRLFYLKNN